MFSAVLDLLLFGSFNSKQVNHLSLLNALMLQRLDLVPVLINNPISGLNMVHSGIILELEGHHLHEGLLETVKLLNEVLLFLLDVVALFLLERIDLFLQGQDQLFALIELLLGLIYEHDVDLVLVEGDLVLFEEFNHALDLVNEDLHLGS